MVTEPRHRLDRMKDFEERAPSIPLHVDPARPGDSPAAHAILTIVFPHLDTALHLTSSS
jgi:hypothetical protein